MDSGDKIMKFLKRDFLQNLLIKLCAFNTSNPPGNEEKLAVFIAEFLKSYGIQDVKIENVSENRANVVATINKKENAPYLMFAGHMDVVPVTSKWKTDPFNPVLDGNRLYARGSCDMKGGLSAMIGAFLELAADTDFKGNLLLLATCDEEVGCSGIQNFFKDANEQISISGALIGEPTNNRMAIGEKGALWVKLSSTGIAAHSAQPELGKNAIFSLIDVIQKIKTSSFFERDDLTSSLNIISGGNKENIVPDSAFAILDFRFHSTIHSSDILNELAKLTKSEEIAIDILLIREPFQTNKDNKLVQTCAQVLTAYKLKKESLIMNYFTDGAFTALSGIPTIIIGPGDPKLAHKDNEYVEIPDVVRSSQLYYETAKSYFK